jgi:hypothetical protein
VQQPPEAFVVTVVETPADEITIGDVIFGSFGIVGLLVTLALVLGGLMSLLLVLWNRRHPPEANHMPSVAQLSETPRPRPSYPAR